MSYLQFLGITLGMQTGTVSTFRGWTDESVSIGDHVPLSARRRYQYAMSSAFLFLKSKWRFFSLLSEINLKDYFCNI